MAVFHGLPMMTAIASLTMAVGYMVAAALNQLKSAVALEQAQEQAPPWRRNEHPTGALRPV